MVSNCNHFDSPSRPMNFNCKRLHLDHNRGDGSQIHLQTSLCIDSNYISLAVGKIFKSSILTWRDFPWFGWVGKKYHYCTLTDAMMIIPCFPNDDSTTFPVCYYQFPWDIRLGIRTLTICSIVAPLFQRFFTWGTGFS